MEFKTKLVEKQSCTWWHH